MVKINVTKTEDQNKNGQFRDTGNSDETIVADDRLSIV
jgi:hypothetical protein